MSTPPLGPVGDFQGKIVSATGDLYEGMKSISNYVDSTYILQQSDTQLESYISNQETTISQNFQQQLTAPGDSTSVYQPTDTNYLWQMQTLSATPNMNSTIQSQLTTLSSLYSQANAQNGAVIKTLDGQNSSAQNILSQNSQAQQTVTQTMGFINGVLGNLSHLIQG
ncbi:hypothetical protein [Rhabdochlamydiaceae symbiont of Dictyostelium giganteum]|uniref:hypothetical protein n=1 Tax=Rhabdochlamydiaceae symbiont of Dictyostelium giganteum TaxID=3342349 RepID=UPI0038503914